MNLKEAFDGNQGPVLESALQRLSSSSCAERGHRAHSRRPGYGLRRVYAPLLATGLLLRRPEGSAAEGEDPRRGASRLSRPRRRGRPARTALPAPRHIAGIRARRRQGDTLLLSRLAVRCRRHDPRNPRRAATSRLKDRLFHGAYPIHEAHGILFAYLGPPEQKPAFPTYDSFVRPGFRVMPGQKYFYPCNWLQILENTMDAVHTAFLHTIVSGAVFTDE